MIMVDDRERRSGICEALAQMGVPYEVKRLAVADYVVRDEILIERKSVPDFLESVQDMRLFDQMACLRRQRTRAVLVVEGGRLPGWPRVRGVLCTLAAQWCMPVLRSRDTNETAWLLAHMHEHHLQHLAPYHRYDPRTKRHVSSLQERMLMQLRNVGPGMARALLKHFGSVHAVLSASREKLLAVDGVGPFIARQIELLRGME